MKDIIENLKQYLEYKGVSMPDDVVKDIASAIDAGNTDFLFHGEDD